MTQIPREKIARYNYVHNLHGKLYVEIAQGKQCVQRNSVQSIKGLKHRVAKIGLEIPFAQKSMHMFRIKNTKIYTYCHTFEFVQDCFEKGVYLL